MARDDGLSPLRMNKAPINRHHQLKQGKKAKNHQNY
jgi:hypothetical protein